FAVGDEFVRDFAGEVARDGEADAGVQAANEGVHADDFAVNVHERAAAVAGIDVGVGLDEVLVHEAAAGEEGHDVGAALGADVPERDGVIQTERRANGN